MVAESVLTATMTASPTTDCLLAPKERQALSSPDTLFASVIDHHQAPRHSEHLAGIGEENPGGVLVRGNPDGIRNPHRFRVE
jgi:hypothetical protein